MVIDENNIAIFGGIPSYDRAAFSDFFVYNLGIRFFPFASEFCPY